MNPEKTNTDGQARQEKPLPGRRASGGRWVNMKGYTDRGIQRKAENSNKMFTYMSTTPITISAASPPPVPPAAATAVIYQATEQQQSERGKNRKGRCRCSNSRPGSPTTSNRWIRAISSSCCKCCGVSACKQGRCSCARSS